MFGLIRKPAVVGSFYPSDPTTLRRMIENFLSATRVQIDKVRALVVPHAGYIYSGQVAATGYSLIKDFSHVLLFGPSHYAMFTGAVQSCADVWETPLGKVKVRRLKGFECADLVHEPEHCLEVQIPFLQVVLKEFVISPLLLGGVDVEQLAKQLIKYIDANTLVIASSDLSHYLPYAHAKEIDALANKVVPELDFVRAQQIQACGKNAILTLMHIAKIKGWKGVFIDYKTSGDTAGEKSSVVGYGCYGFVEG